MFENNVMQTQRQYLARMYETRRPVHVRKDVGRRRETKDDDVVLTSYEVNGLLAFPHSQYYTKGKAMQNNVHDSKRFNTF